MKKTIRPSHKLRLARATLALLTPPETGQARGGSCSSGQTFTHWEDCGVSKGDACSNPCTFEIE